MSSTFDTWVKFVLFFPIIIFLVLFTFNVLQDTGDDYIIGETYDITIGMMERGELNVSQETIDFLKSTEEQYYLTTIPIDLVFLSIWIEFFLITGYSAYKSRKKNIFTFYGLITFGSMLFLFIGTFITQIVNWLFESFYYNFFNLTRVSTPIAEYYIANSALLNFIWFIILLLINQFDFKWVTGRLEGRSQA